MGLRLHGVASRTGKIESRAGKVERRRFLRLKFRRTRYHNRSHARVSRRVAPGGGPTVRIRLPPAASPLRTLVGRPAPRSLAERTGYRNAAGSARRLVTETAGT